MDLKLVHIISILDGLIILQMTQVYTILEVSFTDLSVTKINNLMVKIVTNVFFS